MQTHLMVNSESRLFPVKADRRLWADSVRLADQTGYTSLFESNTATRNSVELSSPQYKSQSKPKHYAEEHNIGNSNNAARPSAEVDIKDL